MKILIKGFKYIIIVFSFFYIQKCYSQDDSITIRYSRFFLPNDMRVILCPDKTSPTVTAVMMYRVGSKDESPERTGFAHFFEHLMFEGSNNIKHGEIDDLIQIAGGTINGITTNDYTVYYSELPSNQIKLGLWIEAERMKSARIEEAGIESQRRIIREERKQLIDNKQYGFVIENILAYNGLGTPYSWAPIGSAQYIDRARIGEFQDFYKKFYVPNNAILILSGDFDTIKTKSWILDYFSGIPKGNLIPRQNFEWKPSTKELQIDIKDSKNDLPAISYSYKTIGKKDSDYIAVALLSKILVEGRSSKISQNLISTNSLALDVQGLPLFFEKGGILGIFAVMYPSTIFENIMLELDREISNISNSEVTDQDLNKAKNMMEFEMVEERSNTLEKSIKLGELDFYFQKPALINKEISMMKAITKNDILRVAKKYLDPDNRVILRYKMNK